MAGTGHAYEIANIDSVREYLSQTCDRLPDGLAKDWFFSKIVLKNITRPQFTIKLSPSMPEESLPAMRPKERPFLLKKLKTGGDVRVFSREALSRSGLDLSHAADWLGSLDQKDPVLKKLHRMDPISVLARADDWSAALSSAGDTHEGTKEAVLKTNNGRTWFLLKDDDALLHEGARMNHCVGNKDYRQLNSNNSVRIYSLRSPAGKPIVTAEFVLGSQTFRQLQRYGNRPIGFVDRRDLCELANFMADVAPSRSMEFAGLCKDVTGKWRPFEDFAQNISAFDFSALVSAEMAGSKLFLTSPRNPEASMAVFTSPHPLWWEHQDPARAEKDRIQVQPNVDETQITHIDEQRHLANFINTVNLSGFEIPAHTGVFEFGEPNPWPFFNEGGKLVPSVDTLDEIVTDDVSYLNFRETYFLQAPGNKARTLATAKVDRKRNKYVSSDTIRRGLAEYVVELKKEIDPTPATLRRVVRFLNALTNHQGLRYVKFDSSDVGSDRKIRNIPDMGFVYVPDHTISERIEDGSGVWRRTPWSTSLSMKSQYSKSNETEMLRAEFTPCNADKSEREIHWISHVLPTADAVDLFCDELNRQNAVPGASLFKNSGLKHWTGPRPVFARGKWHRYTDFDGYFKKLKGKAKTLRLKPIDAEVALDVIARSPHPLTKEASELLKSALVAWGLKVKVRGKEAASFYAGYSLSSPYGRAHMLMLFYGQGHLTEKEEKAVRRVGEACISFQFRRAGRSRYSFDGEAQTRDLFKGLFNILSDKMVIRYARRVHHDNAFTFFKQRFGNRELDPAWIERLKNVDTQTHARHLKNSAVETIGDLGFVAGDPDVKIAKDWFDLFQIVVDMKLIDSYSFQRGAENFLKILSERAETDSQWRDLYERRSIIEEALKEKARRAEERHKDFMARFRNSSENSNAEAA